MSMNRLFWAPFWHLSGKPEEKEKSLWKTISFAGLSWTSEGESLELEESDWMKCDFEVTSYWSAHLATHALWMSMFSIYENIVCQATIF